MILAQAAELGTYMYHVTMTAVSKRGVLSWFPVGTVPYLIGDSLAFPPASSVEPRFLGLGVLRSETWFDFDFSDGNAAALFSAGPGFKPWLQYEHTDSGQFLHLVTLREQRFHPIVRSDWGIHATYLQYLHRPHPLAIDDSQLFSRNGQCKVSRRNSCPNGERPPVDRTSCALR